MRRERRRELTRAGPEAETGRTGMESGGTNFAADDDRKSEETPVIAAEEGGREEKGEDFDEDEESKDGYKAVPIV